MSTILAATLMALIIFGAPTLIDAAESELPEGMTTEAGPGGDATPPAGEAGEDEAVEGAADEAPSGDGLSKNFTRHRAGACPEGPPCAVEDEDKD